MGQILCKVPLINHFCTPDEKKGESVETAAVSIGIIFSLLMLVLLISYVYNLKTLLDCIKKIASSAKGGDLAVRIIMEGLLWFFLGPFYYFYNCKK